MKTTVELRIKQKIKFYEEGMKGDHVLVHLDARKSGVSVPQHLLQNYSLTLKLSYLFQGKTEHNNEAISAYLKFGNDYCHCVVPWKAVWGITPSQGKNMVWPEDLPKELILEFTKAKFKELGAKIFGQSDDQKIKAEEILEKKEEDKETSPTENSPEERRKMLKLIK